MQNYKKILVVNLGGIGDLLLSTPALRSLKKAFPGASLEVLIVPRAVEAVRELPYISKVHFFYFGWRYIFRNIQTVLGLRRSAFDIAMNMRTLNSYVSAQKMRLFLRLIKPKLRAGRNTAGRGAFFDIQVPESALGEVSVMAYDMELAQAAGAPAGDRTIDFAIGPADAARVGELFAASGIRDTDLVVGIAPGGRENRRWPGERFSLLMQKLSGVAPCRFVITGDVNEKLLAQAIAKDMPSAVDLSGKLSLKELGACIGRCRLFISNDTGSMHVAAIVKTPLVAIFGPGSLAWYDPRHISDKVKVVYKKIACSPCEKPRCAHVRCLMMVDPDEVLEAAVALLKQEGCI